jgi:predicted RNase H-like nuclease (RuvC/YqgF family)
MQKMPPKEIKCSCGKTYTQHSGLWKHKKKCKQSPDNLVQINNTSVDIDMKTIAETLMQSMKQNKELQQHIEKLEKKNYEYQLQNQQFQKSVYEMIGSVST